MTEKKAKDRTLGRPTCEGRGLSRSEREKPVRELGSRRADAAGRGMTARREGGMSACVKGADSTRKIPRRKPQGPPADRAGARPRGAAGGEARGTGPPGLAANGEQGNRDCRGQGKESGRPVSAWEMTQVCARMGTVGLRGKKWAEAGRVSLGRRRGRAAVDERRKWL